MIKTKRYPENSALFLLLVLFLHTAVPAWSASTSASSGNLDIPAMPNGLESLAPASSSGSKDSLSSPLPGMPPGVKIPKLPGQAPSAGETHPSGTGFEIKPAEPSIIEASFSTSSLTSGSTNLHQFGYDLFEKSSRAFNSALDAPVGPDYVLGPGDTVIINLWGLIETNLQLQVDREGKIFLPKAGPVAVWGLTLEDARALIRQELSRYFTKFQMSVSMGNLRTIKVFILGEAAIPGAYDLSAVSTLSNALFAAGGPSRIGTLRKIRHFRKNQLLDELDLYDLLLKGDRSKDARMESGDVVFIPPIGATAGITGNVKRPAIYELAGKETVGDLIGMAGGLTPFAYLKKVQIERIKERRERFLLDLESGAGDNAPFLQTPIQDADLVKILAIHGRIENALRVEGFVRHPGEYAFREGMKVRDLLPDEELLPESYLNRAEVVRLKADFTNEIIPFNLRALQAGQESENIPLHVGDKIYVSSEIKTAPAVTLRGEVKRPGTYAIIQGERLSSVIRRAGGFTENGWLPSAIFTRESVAREEKKELDIFVKTQQEKLLAETSALTAGASSDTDAKAVQASLQERQSLLSLVASKVALGRVVIHLDQPEKLEKSDNDLLLEDGDTLQVPQAPNSVVVIGSVRNATGILYKEGSRVKDYLRLAGGANPEADEKNLYLIKSDGSALGDISGGTAVDRGDTLVVPVSTEVKYRTLPLWRDIATIVGQFAITLAAIHVLF